MYSIALTAVLLLAGPRTHPVPTAPATTRVAPAARPAPGDDLERVALTTEDKLSLVGTYLAPRGKGASPGALLIHDAGGNRSDLDDYARRLHKVGFAVLTIDLRGHGESATDELDWEQLDRAGQETLWAFATRDLKAGVEYLRGLKEVHSASLVLIGHRSGATLVVRRAVSDENVRAIALLDPPSEEKDMYGFQLARDIEDLGGLPTHISVPKDAREQAQRMAEGGQRANGGLEFVKISVFRGASPELLHDTREAAEVAKFLKDRAAPSKRSR